MRASELILDQLYKISTSHDPNDSLERMVTIPTRAIGMLQKELNETIGYDRAKGFLLRYGWHCGQSDAEKIKEMDWESQQELLLAGPKMHSLHGYLDVEVVRAKADFTNGTIHHEGIWKNSYEAEEYLKRFGLSKQPVCHSLVGYASGYLTAILGKKVIAREVQCKAMGHENCHAVCHTVEEWGEEIEKDLKYYQTDSIINQLDSTFEKLKIERDNLSKAFEAHQKLMEEVLKETNLSSIAYTLHQIIGMPVFIHNTDFYLLAKAGITEQEISQISGQLRIFHNRKGKKRATEQKSLIKTSLVELSAGFRILQTPVYLQKNVVGYCSVFYRDNNVQEVDKLILERGAVACSLHLLNERTRINTEQRLQGNLLDDILSERIGYDDLAKRSYYIGFKLSAPYFMIGIRAKVQKPCVREELELNNELMNEISVFLKDRKINSLLGQKSGDIIVLLSECLPLNSQSNKQKFGLGLLDYCSKKYPEYTFEMGVSSSSEELGDASQLYDEVLSTLKVANKHQKIVFFDSLGIEGVMFQIKNSSAIRKFIDKKLGKLIEEDKCKDMELTKTLYSYLANGCNLHKTARAMNFSISGLRYRMQKLNEILETDINQPSVGYQTYLALQMLIYLGEVEMDIPIGIDESFTLN
ncbi:MAG TPA: XylR N-terminal domain-containing protein [Chondromyces sp.]|nr:XylR N-terminal domain-containing protein [Chondromyces sp.]